MTTNEMVINKLKNKYQEKILVLQQKVIVGKQIEEENITGTYISRDQTMKDKTSSWGFKY